MQRQLITTESLPCARLNGSQQTHPPNQPPTKSTLPTSASHNELPSQASGPALLNRFQLELNAWDVITTAIGAQAFDHSAVHSGLKASNDRRLNQTRPSVQRVRPTVDDWDRKLKPRIEQLYRINKVSIKDCIRQIEREDGFLITDRMFKRRIKEWGFLKNRKEKEMKAVLRAFRLSKELGQPSSVVRFRGEDITLMQLKGFFRKKLKPGEKFESIPTPSEQEVEGIDGIEVGIADAMDPDEDGSRLVNPVKERSATRRRRVSPPAEDDLTSITYLLSSAAQTETGSIRGNDLRKHIIQQIDPHREESQPSQDSYHPRDLLFLWAEVTFSLGQSWLNKDPRGLDTAVDIIRNADSSLKSLLGKGYVVLIIYLALIHASIPINFPPFYRPWQPSTGDLGLYQRILWKLLVEKLLVLSLQAQGDDHPLTKILSHLFECRIEQIAFIRERAFESLQQILGSDFEEVCADMMEDEEDTISLGVIWDKESSLEDYLREMQEFDWADSAFHAARGEY